MNCCLNILHLEDDPDDATLIHSSLEVGGIECAITRVETRDDFVGSLERGGFDLIISDYMLPGFNGMSALGIVSARWPAIPVIFVSGTLGEERAVDSLKSGATDYVLKDRLARLAPAVRRAMQEVGERAAKRDLEAKFIEAQKMEVVGQLAGGVAHDFNNLLAVIIGYCDLMIQKLVSVEEFPNYLETIRSAAERAGGLTRQLLIFSRKQTVQLVVLDINDVVRDMDKMLRRLIDENIAMSVLPGIDIGRVKADSGYVGQVLMNLVVNARDAMPNGGKITIATENVTVHSDNARAEDGAVPGNYVMLSVTDTGTGMTDAVRARLFEAFFTTKPKGKGTGLGLATCQTIMQQSGGYIGVESKIGVGTTFKIYFPRVDQPLDSPSRSQGAPTPRGTEALLVVEDEPLLRHLARSVLETQGYQVLSAPNGQDALHAVRDHKGSPIQLVITDVVMPLMGGIMMAEWLKTSNPNLKILFTSGYTEESIPQSESLQGGVDFLPKPYTPAILASKVREMLDYRNEPDHQARKGPPDATPIAN